MYDCTEEKETFFSCNKRNPKTRQKSHKRRVIAEGTRMYYRKTSIIIRSCNYFANSHDYSPLNESIFLPRKCT